MSKLVLVTGGAGFIGSHLADELLRHGYRVRAFDNLSPQVHPSRERPDYLSPEVELVTGDVRDATALRAALKGVDGVFHLAAMVGVGQSMYALAPYTDVNNLGTAVLLEALLERPVERLVVASSMSIYGEGLYRSRSGSMVAACTRAIEQLRRGDWDPTDDTGHPLEPVATPEDKPPVLASVYALSKYDQERMSLLVGGAYGIPAVALRFFNAYGPRQALSNPYTGVLAIFAARLLNDRAPLIFEDGRQRRDFVHVQDIARACRLAYETPDAVGQAFNIGSGTPISIGEVALRLAMALGKTHRPQITGKFRAGDVRHCFADIGKARQVLNYQPGFTLEEGLVDLCGWLDGQEAFDRLGEAQDALARRGLTA
jgi:dTDP-L-rhamnose 4-epimerase